MKHMWAVAFSTVLQNVRDTLQSCFYAIKKFVTFEKCHLLKCVESQD